MEGNNSLECSTNMITVQDDSMRAAILIVFRNTIHRNSRWHTMNNFCRTVGSILVKSVDFFFFWETSEEFVACLNYTVTAKSLGRVGPCLGQAKIACHGPCSWASGYMAIPRPVDTLMEHAGYFFFFFVLFFLSNCCVSYNHFYRQKGNVFFESHPSWQNRTPNRTLTAISKP